MSVHKYVRAKNKKLQVEERMEAQQSLEDTPGLEVNVVFTTEQGTAAALRAAGNLARELNVGIRLLVTQLVPFALPLDRPAVAVGFIHDRCRTMALEYTGVTEVRVNVYLCRNRSQAPRRVLSANSLVIVGGKQCWWPTPEQKLAEMLKADGHQVLFADLRSDGRSMKRAFSEDRGQFGQPSDMRSRVAYDRSASTRAQDQGSEGALVMRVTAGPGRS